MRISIDNTDPGNAKLNELTRSGKKVRVLFEGSERTQVIMADEEQRVMTCLRLDDEGRVWYDPKTHRTQKLTHHGTVAILVEDCAAKVLEDHDIDPNDWVLWY